MIILIADYTKIVANLQNFHKKGCQRYLDLFVVYGISGFEVLMHVKENPSVFCIPKDYNAGYRSGLSLLSNW
jgi:hypothetical protein